MGHTLATMRSATKEQRKHRKSKLRDRIKKEIKASGLSDAQVSDLLRRIKLDMDELVEIGRCEGIQQAINEQPVPVMKPVKLSAGAWVPFYGQMMERQEVVAALREAGIQIEGKE